MCLVPETLQIAANAVNAQIFGASSQVKLKISEMLSYEVEGYNQGQNRNTKWDGRSSFFDFKTGIFPAGFVQMIAKELKLQGHLIQFKLIPLPEALGPEVGTFDPFGYGFKERYNYQTETVKKLLKFGRGIARIATGGGKSFVAVLATATINRPTLFITTRKSLMWQMKRNFEKAGMNPGVIGDGIWQPRKGITVAMVQTLSARLKHPNADDSKSKQLAQIKIQNITKAYLSYIEFLIGEEAHEVGGSEYWTITQACRNAHYRIALTATPFMRTNEEANMRLQGAFGSIINEVSEELLINRGILAKPYFKFESVPSPAYLKRGTRWPTCYELNVVENKQRIDILVKNVVRAKTAGLTTMVLIIRKKHGELIKTALEKENIKVDFIFGKHEEEERREALNKLDSKEIDVLIGTSILDVGIDVPSVGMIVIAGGGKAEVKLRQEIGRGLREKKTGANVAFVLGFLDEGNKYTHEHALQRKAIIESTPGFVENILQPGEDFPYDLITAD